MQQSAESKDRPTLTDQLRVIFGDSLNWAGGKLNSWGIHPNMLTLTGVIGTALGAYYVAVGKLMLGGLIIILMGPIDALDGACHRAYGSMPNMTWIFNRLGTAIYKSDWTDSHSVENAIGYFLDVLDRRRDGERITPFHVERLDYRSSDIEAFSKGLERNGPKALREFREAF